MKRQSDNLTYILIQFCFWMNFPAILSFVSNYLLDSGFQSTQIGIIIAVFGAVSSLLQPVIATYADRPSSPSLKKIILALTAFLLLSALGLIFTHHRSMLATGIFFGLSIMVLQIITPLLNSLGMKCADQGRKINFGLARGLGSVAFAVTSYILGICIDASGTLAIPISTVIGFTGMLILLGIFPFQKTMPSTSSNTDNKKEEMTAPPASADSKQGFRYFFTHYRRFCVVLVGALFLYMSHSLINNFLIQIVESKGGTDANMGIALGIAACTEPPLMFLFVYLTRKIRCDIWFRISGIFFFAKTLGTLLVPTIPALYALQLLQCGGWGLISVSSVYYVNALMEERDAIKGQAYMTMAYTFGTVVSALIGGWLIDSAGVDTMVAFASFCAFVGMVILLLAAERVSDRNI